MSGKTRTPPPADEDVTIPPLAPIEPLIPSAQEAAIAPQDSSATLAAWETKDLDEPEEAPETARPDAREDLTGWIDQITPEEADQILADLTQFEGRLPLPVKRRGADEVLYYCRLPHNGESKQADLCYSRELHRYRKEGLPAMAEFVQELFESLPGHLKEEAEKIQGDSALSAGEKSSKLMLLFLETSYFGLIQNTADIFAHGDRQAFLATRCVEEAHEPTGASRQPGERRFTPLWPTLEAFNAEDTDIAQAVITAMELVHRKLVNVRFLASSSAAAASGDSSAK